MSAALAIVGAGASGLMASILAARTRPGFGVVLLESGERPGLKLLICGGGRCNLTHAAVAPSDYHAHPVYFLRHALKAFSREETVAFFEGIGVPLQEEAGGKVFPRSGKASDVTEALTKEAARLGVRMATGERVASLAKLPEGGFSLRTSKRELRAGRVILATGGCSYPRTGSDGSGWELARGLGHTLVDPAPALTPFLTDRPEWKSLSGVAVTARLSFFRDGKKAAEAAGQLLFTHTGFSGPVCLDLSRWYSACEAGRGRRVEADFLPGTPREAFMAFLKGKHPGGQLARNALIKQYALPERLVRVLLERAGVDPAQKAASLSAHEKREVASRVFQCPLEVSGTAGFEEAEVTAGGIPLSEVDPSTMGSRVADGLYLCGEMLDVDGRVGGFNLQWAWSSGAIAGRAAASAAAASGPAEATIA